MSGSLWLGKEGQDTLPFIPRQRPHAAAPDPIDELAARLEELIAAAVHPDEVAAILESDGMTDAHIRTTYGRQDSFELAEDLYARVERRYPPAASPAADPWHTGLPACLLRGLVFALPGLAYVLGAPLLAGPRTASACPQVRSRCSPGPSSAGRGTRASRTGRTPGWASATGPPRPPPCAPGRRWGPC